MRTVIIKEPDGKPNKVIPVPGHYASFFTGGKFQLFLIRYLKHTSLVGAYGVDPIFSKDLSNFRAEVLIQIEFHDGELMKG
jgi:hypothetical protein